MSTPQRSVASDWLTRIGEHGAGARARSLVHLEVNGLSQLNATFGRKAGDSLLSGVELALRLRTRRYRDLVWRIGGDELAVLFVGAARLQALRAIRRIFAEPLLPSVWSGLPIGLSVGIVSLDADTSVEEAAALAESAMCAAKRAGRAAATIGRDATSLRVALRAPPDGASPAAAERPRATGDLQWQAS